MTRTLLFRPFIVHLQDLLIFSLKGLGGWAHLATQNGVEVPQEIQSFITGATFSTLTNGKQHQLEPAAINV
jgi:hydroxylamine reductase (hybrid-cluster protein)